MRMMMYWIILVVAESVVLVLSKSSVQFKRSLAFHPNYDPSLILSQENMNNVLPSCMTKCSLYTTCLAFLIDQSQCTTLNAILNKSTAANTSPGHLYFERYVVKIVNVAKGKTTYQTSKNSDTSSHFAIDGQLFYDNDTCKRSSQAYDEGFRPSWTIDLGQSFSIYTVRFVVGKNSGTEECKTTKLGQEYTGKVKTTKTDIACQRWDVQSPHQHVHSSLGDQENYCRNPDNEPEGVWCYTLSSSTRWDYCDVPLCINTVHGVSILVGQTSDNITTQCGFYDGPPIPTQWVTIYCPPLTSGRYVRLQKHYTEFEMYLQLCEVEIQSLE